MKPKIIRSLLVDPIFCFRWYFQRFGSEQSAYDWFAQKIGAPKFMEGQASNGSFAYNGDICTYAGMIWLSENAGSKTVVHEAKHLLTAAAKVLDIDLNTADEFGAHYIAWISDHMFEKLFKVK